MTKKNFAKMLDLYKKRIINFQDIAYRLRALSITEIKDLTL